MKLKDFAAQIGLSPTTVSRALSGYPEVSDKTRKRVEAEAARLGYHPDVNAVRLATGRAGAIGVAMTRAGDYQFSEFINGMAERLSGGELDILLIPMGEHETVDELQVFRRLAQSRRVDAVVIHSPVPDDPRIALLDRLKIPFIVHGRSLTTVPHAWLDIDNEAVTRRATDHLLDLGHRRICLINGPDNYTFARDRDHGYRTALQARRIAYDETLVHHGTFSDETGFRFASTALSKQARPTAFVAGSMMTALGIYRAARSLGLAVGSDISVVAHDDVFPYLTAETMTPALSTTRSSIRAAGREIADLLLQMLDGRKPSDIAELWPVDLILRDSSRPAPKEPTP
ncbi:substrate-binding domain-containing protein [Peteryoungia ipomoeae]|uniref:LacI family transcriptional regulator n=1 Tax=Peteryoungia ipomoeae TaxID=1210932 RepID=A0A4S8NV45_9HYPH|nr:substrate-binding domain-containing protein [Peteryoungia ipomoeae]THV20641.1 LacI family transcriptional regulator [Peteryoungia ipomoeae]